MTAYEWLYRVFDAQYYREGYEWLHRVLVEAGYDSNKENPDVAGLVEENERLRADLEFKMELLGRYEPEFDRWSAVFPDGPEDALVVRDYAIGAEARIEAALALHFEVKGVCAHCSYYWPCPTVKTLRGEP